MDFLEGYPFRYRLWLLLCQLFVTKSITNLSVVVVVFIVILDFNILAHGDCCLAHTGHSKRPEICVAVGRDNTKIPDTLSA